MFEVCVRVGKTVSKQRLGIWIPESVAEVEAIPIPLLILAVGYTLPRPDPCPIFVDTHLHALIIQAGGLHKPGNLEPGPFESPTREVEPLRLSSTMTVHRHFQSVRSIGK